MCSCRTVNLAFMAVLLGCEVVAVGAPSTQPATVPRDQAMERVYSVFRESGLGGLGMPKDEQLVRYARSIADNAALDDFKSAFDRYDALQKQLSQKGLESLQDDLLLRRIELLFYARQFPTAAGFAQEVIDRYPQGVVDLRRVSSLGCASGFGPGMRRQALANYYILVHPNSSADLARLRLAQIHIGQHEDEKAKDMLRTLIPSAVRPPSEDPLARRPDASDATADYAELLENNDLQALLAGRTDKIALLYLARLETATGDAVVGKALFARLVEIFPTSSQPAIHDLRRLDAGDVEAVKAELQHDGRDPVPSLPLSLSREVIVKLAGDPDVARRIRAVRSYLEDNDSKASSRPGRPATQP